MKGKFYKGLWVFAFLLVIVMFSSIVVYAGEDESFTSELPTDGLFVKLPVVNGSEDVSEDVIDEPSLVVPRKDKRSNSYHYSVEDDGSLTFRASGTIVQYPDNNMIIKWDKGVEGVYCWNYLFVNYCGTFYSGYDYNFVNVRVV